MPLRRLLIPPLKTPLALLMLLKQQPRKPPPMPLSPLIRQPTPPQMPLTKSLAKPRKPLTVPPKRSAKRLLKKTPKTPRSNFA